MRKKKNSRRTISKNISTPKNFKIEKLTLKIFYRFFSVAGSKNVSAQKTRSLQEKPPVTLRQKVSCKLCGKKFSKRNCKIHQKKCRVKFSRTLRTKVSDNKNAPKRGKTENYFCKNCCKRFKSSQNLKRHIKLIHNKHKKN